MIPSLSKRKVDGYSVGFRTMRTSSMFGCISPSTVRSIACHVNESALTGLKMWVDVVFPPSASTPVCCTIQRFPLCFHLPSEYPPLESKTHERTCLAIGSQPMICIPEAFTLSPIATANERVIKLRFFVHSQSV